MKLKNVLIKGMTTALTVAMIVVGIPVGVTQAATYSIPSDAKSYKGHQYKVFYTSTAITWERAEQYCEARGGHLVTMTSAGEATFVEKIASAVNSDDYFWIGGEYVNNKWTWVTGEKMSYKKPLYIISTQNNLVLDTGDGTWENYYYGDKQNYYICEWDTSTADILPDQVTLSSVKKVSSTSVMISWKKVSDAKGYAVYMKTGKNGTYKKIKTISGKNNTAMVKTKLKKGKTYYFRVRAYKTIYGEKSYGELSNVKSIKLK